MSPTSIKASSLCSEAHMSDCTKLKFDLPVGTWEHTRVEVEFPRHRDPESIILPLLEKAHEQQAERQRRYRAEGLTAPINKSHSNQAGKVVAAERIDDSSLPVRVKEDMKLYLNAFDTERDVASKPGETFPNVLEQYAEQTGKDEERLDVFYQDRHAGRGMTPDSGSKRARSYRSMSSLNSAITFRASREEDRLSTRRVEGENEPERDSILVVNDTGIERSSSPDSSTFSAPLLPERNPLRDSHYRTISAGSAASDKALRLLGFDSTNPQHQLKRVGSIVPFQHFSSGAVTQVDLHPGPSRLAQQHVRKASVASAHACDVSVISSDQRPQQLDQHTSENSSLHDSLSPIGRGVPHEQVSRPGSMTSSLKARRMLGVDRPDSAPGPGGRPGSVHANYASNRTLSHPPAIPTNNYYYPTSTTSHAHPKPFACRKALREYSSNTLASRSRSDLVGIPDEGAKATSPNRRNPLKAMSNKSKTRSITKSAAKSKPNIKSKRTSAIVCPFAAHENDDDDQDDHGDDNNINDPALRSLSLSPYEGAKLTTICSGPIRPASRPRLLPAINISPPFEDRDWDQLRSQDVDEVALADADVDEVGGAAGLEHVIQYRVRGRAMRINPRMTGRIVSFVGGRRRSFSA